MFAGLVQLASPGPNPFHQMLNKIEPQNALEFWLSKVTLRETCTIGHVHNIKSLTCYNLTTNHHRVFWHLDLQLKVAPESKGQK